IRSLLRRVIPPSIVIDTLRTRLGLRCGIPAILLAILYLSTASLLPVIIRDGGPGWLNIIVLIAIWSALKMLWIGPVSLILLARVRWHEHTERNSRARAIAEPTVST